MSEKLELKDFCKQFVTHSINLAEFFLVNKDEAESFLQKLFLIKMGINLHIRKCDTCKLDFQDSLNEQGSDLIDDTEINS